MNRVKKFKIKVNGQVYEVEVEELAGESPKRPQPAFDQDSAVPENVTGKVVAPMPGVITAVKTEVGDKVVPEQALLTLEAMKMENEIPAGRSGRVKQILVTVGQSVSSGELLVIVE